NGGTLNLDGNFTPAALGTLARSGGTINLTGTLDATGSALGLNSSTGSWNLLGGILKGGTYSATGGAALIFTTSGGTLDGITAASDLNLAQPGAQVTVQHGLTLQGNTVHIGSNETNIFTFADL